MRPPRTVIIAEGIFAFRAGKRATNNFERERAFPGRLTGVPGKRCFVNAVGSVVLAGVATVERGWTRTVVEKFESEWPRDIPLFPVLSP